MEQKPNYRKFAINEIIYKKLSIHLNDRHMYEYLDIV